MTTKTYVLTMLLFFVVVVWAVHSTVPPPVRAADAPNQRFVPALQPEGLVEGAFARDFALDSKTGQLCLTRPFAADSPISKLPLCLDLYKKF